MNKIVEIAKSNGAVFEGVCQSCGGSGVVMEEITVPVCCGRFYPHGDCCGNPDQKQDYQPQPCQCGGQVWAHITEAGLRTTVEQVCAPFEQTIIGLIAHYPSGLNPFLDKYINDARSQLQAYRALIGDKHE